MNILDATRDKNLFAPWFKDRNNWTAWFAFLAALFALPMTEAQLTTYKECTGRAEPPREVANEAWLVCGRRAGKSFVLALVAVFIACFRDYRKYLAPGERATVMVIAADRRQARIVLRYVRGLLNNVPMLARMVERETAEGFDLDNGTTIEVHIASFRSTRGYAIAAALLDEISFWPTDDAAEPDYEVVNALRPGMAQFPNAMLLCASSPYSRRGALWTAHRKHFGKDGDPVLVWQAATRTMNPSVPQRVIDEAMERDPASAAAEYLAQFRSDLEAFVSLEAIHACIQPNVRERPPTRGISYRGFVDPSGGRVDSFTLAIGHYETARQTVVLDALREIKSPFSPEATVQEFSALLKTYNISSVQGDKFAGMWPIEQFAKFAIRYEPSAAPKSDLYRDLLPLLNSLRVELLDNPRLVNQLVGLERRTARGGRIQIDHSPGGRDDVSNVLAGVAAMCVAGGSYNLRALAGLDDDPDDPNGFKAFERMRFAMHIASNS